MRISLRKYIILCLALLLIFSATAEEAQETLIIDRTKLTGEPTFIDWTQDGIDLQLIALTDAEGEAHLALNTCQSCQGSPWAWFEYPGNGLLQCQNCMQLFPASAIGGEATPGCGPIPLTAFTVEEDDIIVDAEALAEVAPLFINWKRIEG